MLNGQIAREVFLMQLSQMKNILDLEEYRLGSKNDSFRYFKKKVMNEFYEGSLKLFQTWEEMGLIEPCECGSYLRHGWQQCEDCRGAGYQNTEELNNFLSE